MAAEWVFWDKFEVRFNFIAACVELLPPFLNDNITIPVISGGVMEALARINGWI